VDPVTLQVFAGALRAAAEEMGAVLVRAAHSANIKERRDCSTALFDRDGAMVAQAEHIPVHLGAMPAAVAAVLAHPQAPGRSYVVNDPYAGGTHLPDITVVTPAHDGEDRLLGFVASRAHHADVGGRVPGSMPADSTTLDEEGVVIAPQPLTAALVDELAARMRQPAQRRADLRAQLAANATGARRMAELARASVPTGCRTPSPPVLDYAERRTRAQLPRCPTACARPSTCSRRARATSSCACAPRSAATRSCSTSPAAPRSTRATSTARSVTRSACLFALRVLTDPDIPASAGAERPLQVVAPHGSLLNARSPAAVAGGNVETSSRVADLVLGAFGHALGQGTMNNLTLGSDAFTYYETIGGGQGACADADGPTGVHVAMSNTLNTPVEALEQEFPLRVVAYAVRRGSGGAGAHRGGDGVVREVEALAPMTYSLLTERRRHAPRGAAGGADGARGRNLLDGAELPPKATGELRPGQRLRIETPGGGGYGLAEADG
jgi:N-methylhydantoinase B